MYHAEHPGPIQYEDQPMYSYAEPMPRQIQQIYPSLNRGAQYSTQMMYEIHETPQDAASSVFANVPVPNSRLPSHYSYTPPPQPTFVYSSRPPSPQIYAPPLQPTHPIDFGASRYAHQPQQTYETRPYYGVIQPKNNHAELQPMYFQQGQVGAQEAGKEARRTLPTLQSTSPVEKGEMTCGKNYAVFSALLLLGSGIVLVVIGPMHYDAPVKSFDTICTMIKSVDGCSGGTMFGAKSVYSQNFGGELTVEKCRLGMKEALGCKCQGSTLTCDCSDTGFGLLETAWKIVMIVLGAAGCGICFLVAIFALSAVTRTKNTCCPSCLCAWSALSSFFTLIYGGIGAVLILFAVVTNYPTGNVLIDFISNCKPTLMKTVSVGDTAGVCQIASTCKFIDDIRDKARIIGFGLGIPYAVCGILMFAGAYACCCCRSHFIVPPITDQKKVVRK